MSATDLPPASGSPVAHPLAVELARSLSARKPPVAVLLLGVGSGRNIPVLLGSGATVEAIDEDPERRRLVETRFAGAAVRVTTCPFTGPYPFATPFAGALSTHALLHGSRTQIATAIAAVRAALAPRGLLHATLGSTSDPRFRTGRQIEEGTFAPLEGPERGVPHTYFDEIDVRSLLADFNLHTLEERSAAETAGRWAHSADEAQTLVHWFVRASSAS